MQLQNKLLTLAILSMHGILSFSQTQVLTPKIISAEAASLGKFGDLPVGKFTGVPDISIPIYNVSIGAFKMPVQLRYHASGIKIGEQSSNVGTGWALDAGGCVSHTIYGNDDFSGSGAGFINAAYRLPTHTLNPSFDGSATDYPGGYDYFFAKKVASHEIDAQPDLFQYNFNGNSGNFYFDYNQQAHPIPMNSLKFEMANSSFTGRITDINGHKYIFSDPESTEFTDYCGPHTYYGTSFLSKIILPEKDSIVFNYDTLTYSYNAKGNTARAVPKPGNGNIDVQIVSQGLDCYGGPDPVAIVIHSKRLSSIATSRGITILFNYSGDRYDLARNQKLSSINIQYNGNTIKTITLYQSYFTPSGYGIPSAADYDVLRLKLDSVNMGSPAETYAFQYNESIALPNKLSNSVDHYGYYNGASNSTLLPLDNDYGFSTGASREVDTAYLQAGIIKSLFYPTGGRTDFYLEANTYYKNSQTKFAGGLRVKQLITTSLPGDPKPLIKSFSYSDPSIGHTSGLVSYEPVYVASCPYTAIVNVSGTNTTTSSDYWRQSSNALMPLTTNQGSTIGYTYVEELVGSGGENGKNICKYAYTGDYGGSLTSPSVPVVSMDWQNGRLLEETVYRKSSGGYDPVSRRINYYSINPESAFWNTHYDPASYVSNDYFRGWGVSLEYKHAEYFDELVFYPAEFKYNDYHFISKWIRLDSTVVYTFQQGDTTKYARNFSSMDYGNMYNFQPTTVSTYNSKGLLEQEIIKYPNDPITGLTTDAQNAKSTLVNANRINEVLEHTKIINNSEVSKNRNNFYNYSDGGTRISQVQFSYRAGNLQQRLLVNNYDSKGNIAEYTDEHGAVKSYLYGYSNLYPIAEVTNAAAGAIAYTSFEPGGAGNWNYSGSAVTSLYGTVMGNNALALSTSNVQRTALSSSETYLLTYWANGSSVSVNAGSAGNALMNRNGWTLFSKEITGETSVTISGSAVIDELRLYPKTAMMSTYTYNPLVGITSECDTNNRITYYEYDSYGRLICVRDMDKNIVKSYQYTYRGAQ